MTPPSVEDVGSTSRSVLLEAATPPPVATGLPSRSTAGFAAAGAALLRFEPLASGERLPPGGVETPRLLPGGVEDPDLPFLAEPEDVGVCGRAAEPPLRAVPVSRAIGGFFFGAMCSLVGLQTRRSGRSRAHLLWCGAKLQFFGVFREGAAALRRRRSDVFLWAFSFQTARRSCLRK